MDAFNTRSRPQRPPEVLSFVTPSSQVIFRAQASKDCLGLNIASRRDIAAAVAIGSEFTHRKSIDFAGGEMGMDPVLVLQRERETRIRRPLRKVYLI